MALSEHDKRVLSELEAEFEVEVASRRRYPSTVVLLVIAVVGCGLILAGLGADSARGVVSAVIGFCVLVLSLQVTTTAARRRRTAPARRPSRGWPTQFGLRQ